MSAVPYGRRCGPGVNAGGFARAPSSRASHAVNYGLFRRSPFPAAQERVGTAERGAVLDLLSRALGEGFLELGEYDSRITAVHSARTVGDLMGQVADLPPAFRWPPQPPPMAGVPVAGPFVTPPQAPAGAFAAPPPAHVGPFVTPPSAAATGAAHGMAIASAVFGAISIVTALCAGIGVLFGLAAVLLAIFPMRAKDNTARVGMALGFVGIALAVAVFALSFVANAAPFPGSVAAS